MKRSVLNFAIDLVTFVVFLGLLDTGLLLRYVLPPGSGHNGIGVLGLTRHEWGAVHFWLSVFTVALIGVHIALHWRWICSILIWWGSDLSDRDPRSPRPRTTAIITVAVLTLAIVGPLGVAVNIRTSTAAAAGRGYGHGAGRGASHGVVDDPEGWSGEGGDEEGGEDDSIPVSLDRPDDTAESREGEEDCSQSDPRGKRNRGRHRR